MPLKKILMLPGDGVGPEIISQADKILHCLIARHGLCAELKYGHIGGDAYERFACPLPDDTLAIARDADAILLGAVGGPKWDTVESSLRPERGLLSIRSALGLFTNLRPVVLYHGLEAASTLKKAVVHNLDILIIRELTGGIYFGKPRGIVKQADGSKQGINTLIYNEAEIERIARMAFEIGLKRKKKICSVDKANVLEATQLWRQVITQVAKDYPNVELTHMYVDNAAMQLVKQPKQFDVIVTTNLFGDILSDLAAMLTGSIGMLPSASINERRRGLYEPIHGSAPDIAGQNIANPLAMILSVAMMLRHSLEEPLLADKVEQGVHTVLDQGIRTVDICPQGMQQVSTDEMGDAVVAALSNQD